MDGRNAFHIFDRLGTTIQTNPCVLGANRRTTGESAAVMFFCSGSDAHSSGAVQTLCREKLYRRRASFDGPRRRYGWPVCDRGTPAGPTRLPAARFRPDGPRGGASTVAQSVRYAHK